MKFTDQNFKNFYGTAKRILKILLWLLAQNLPDKDTKQKFQIKFSRREALP